MKIIFQRFHIKIPFTFWYICMWDMWKVCLHSETIECVKNKPTFKEIYELNGQIPQTFLRIKRAKISGFYFYMNTSI